MGERPKVANDGVTGIYAHAEVAASGDVAVLYIAVVVSSRSPASPATQLTSFGTRVFSHVM